MFIVFLVPALILLGLVPFVAFPLLPFAVLAVLLGGVVHLTRSRQSSHALRPH